MSKRRTEADLRAAFALAAQDAPNTQDVLARLAASERPQPQSARRRAWWPLAAVAAAVVVIAVPIGFAISQGGGSNTRSSSLSLGSAQAKGAATGDAGSAYGVTPAVPGGSGPVPPVGPSPQPSAGHVCTPADLTLSLVWTTKGDRLTGSLTATNHTSAACDLAVKPGIYPLDTKGNRLAVSNVVSAEGYAGPTRLMPGTSAASTVTWTSWCGTAPSATTQADWGTGIATVVATGPTAPACTSGVANTISAGWFGPLS